MKRRRLTVSIGPALKMLLGVLFTTVGWMAIQIWDMHPKVTETARRVDRIVDALPEVKTRIIQEDMHKRIQVAFVARDPVETSPGHWAKPVEVFDYVAGRSEMFSIPIKSQDDPSGSLVVAGVVSKISRDNYSFDDWSAATRDNAGQVTYDMNIDTGASFAVFKTSTRYTEQLTTAFGEPLVEQKIEKKMVRFPQLAEDLRRRGPLKAPTPHP
jgi:hypothetical protein